MRLLVLMCVACTGRASPPAAPAKPDAAPAAAGCETRKELAEGLTLERHALPDGDTCLTLVRIDPRRWRFELRTAAADGGARPAPRWSEEFDLTGVINTSMFADDERSIGLLRDARTVNNPRDNARLGGFLLFDPVDARDPPVAIAGRSCPGFDLAALQQRYRGIVQDYRMLDCDGKAIAWADEKTFSAAAIGLDREGRVVFIHSRTPFRMTRFNQIIAAPELGLAGAIYVEGGPEASLYVKAGGEEVREVGSFETGFFDESNRTFWAIPNVLGFAPRQAPAAP